MQKFFTNPRLTLVIIASLILLVIAETGIMLSGVVQTYSAKNNPDIPIQTASPTMPVQPEIQDPFRFSPGKPFLEISENKIYENDGNGKKTLINYVPPTDYPIQEAVYNHKKTQVVVLVGDEPGNGVAVGETAHGTQVILVNKDGTNPKILATEGEIPAGIDKDLGLLGNILFSNDDKKIYFNSNYGGPGTWLYEVNLDTLKIREIPSGGVLIDIVPTDVQNPRYKKYIGNLLIVRHQYFEIGGAYDFIWLVNPVDGKLTSDVPVMRDEQNLNGSLTQFYDWLMNK